jgi:hypothetical protein
MDGFPTPAKRNKTLGRARNSTPQEEIWPQQNRGDKRARNFAGANNTKLFRSKYAPEILMSDDTEGFVTGASGFRRSHRMYVTCGSRSRLRFCLASS